MNLSYRDQIAIGGNAHGRGRQDIQAIRSGDAYVGLMRWKEGEPFEYWIGVFCPESAAAPEGYSFKDFEEADLASHGYTARKARSTARSINAPQAAKPWGIKSFRTARGHTGSSNGMPARGSQLRMTRATSFWIFATTSKENEEDEGYSNTAAARFIFPMMPICCGQTESHWPHSAHLLARPPSRVSQP
jgi:hypothetical protein